MNRSRVVRKSDQGQMLPLISILLGAVVLIGLLVAHVAAAANLQARAQTAADSAALAGVTEGRRSAEVAASANSAQLTSFAHKGSDVVVQVRIEGRQAQARARMGGGLPTINEGPAVTPER